MPLCVVEDSAVLAAQLCRLLASLGKSAVQVEVAAALATCRAEDAVFVSLQLRGDNGFRLLRELHARGVRSLIAISASGRASDRCWALRAGARQLLFRPLDLAGVEACLAGLQLEGSGHV